MDAGRRGAGPPFPGSRGAHSVPPAAQGAAYPQCNCPEIGNNPPRSLKHVPCPESDVHPLTSLQELAAAESTASQICGITHPLGTGGFQPLRHGVHPPQQSPVPGGPAGGGLRSASRLAAPRVCPRPCRHAVTPRYAQHCLWILRRCEAWS